jgi:hypothetical protein
MLRIRNSAAVQMPNPREAPVKPRFPVAFDNRTLNLVRLALVGHEC